MKDVLTIKNLRKSYRLEGGTKQEVLKGITFSLQAGEFAAIIGESGSGKTTLADLIAGINSPSNGTITFEEFESTESSPKIFPTIAYVSQNSSLFGDDIYENIAFGSKDGIVDKKKIDSILNNLNLNVLVTDMDATGLRILRSDGTNLSGGERQRIAIGRSEYADTQIVVFDEPTSSLDEAQQIESKMYWVYLLKPYG